MQNRNRVIALLLPFLLAAFVACGQADGDGGTPQDGTPQSEDSFDEATAREHEGDRPEPGAAADAEPAAPVSAEEVAYAALDGREVTGYFARPEGAEGPLPGLLVIHEWWGLNDNIRTMTERLAGEGYAALAVDLYGGETAESPERARELVQTVDEEQALRNLEAARGFLGERLGADGTGAGGPVGVIGWCFGGGWSLQTALAMPEAVDAAVVYYGRPVTERQELAELQAPLLGIFGAEDGSIPVETVRQMESTLGALGKPVEIHVYEGAGHAFANPSGTRYVPDAAEDAWSETVEFLDRHLESRTAAPAGA
ncbi:MAG: dienelactone hydrolase family protein [Thermoanaerobaculia bacterium]